MNIDCGERERERDKTKGTNGRVDLWPLCLCIKVKQIKQNLFIILPNFGCCLINLTEPKIN